MAHSNKHTQVYKQFTNRKIVSCRCNKITIYTRKIQHQKLYVICNGSKYARFTRQIKNIRHQTCKVMTKRQKGVYNFWYNLIDLVPSVRYDMKNGAKYHFCHILSHLKPWPGVCSFKLDARWLKHGFDRFHAIPVHGGKTGRETDRQEARQTEKHVNGSKIHLVLT